MTKSIFAMWPMQEVGLSRVLALRKAAHIVVSKLVAWGQQLGQWLTGETAVVVISHNITSGQLADLQKRLAFYAPELAKAGLTVRQTPTQAEVWSKRPFLLFDKPTQLPAWIYKRRSGVFDIDYRRNPQDGWAWCDLAAYAAPVVVPPDTQEQFCSYVTQLRQLGLQKSYIFGTGPSLAKAIERDWSDGYRIVCNTIVRDAELWHHLQPHIIVAGDGIYHFGHTRFAHAFRRDLLARLHESEARFVYPARFDAIVRRELAVVAEQLVPIPVGRHRQIHVDICQTLGQGFGLPNMGNVLPLLLLPMGCLLSRQVGLWGFDGRGPNDQLFWKNSNKHSYPELLPDLQKAHPTFFSHNVPKENPTRYIKAVHGDSLDDALSVAEQAGWQFEMLHHSWTETLQKRGLKI
ncbi:MAG: hypothetical protein AAF614_35125 [Chloroflexota bacterium]